MKLSFALNKAKLADLHAKLAAIESHLADMRPLYLKFAQYHLAVAKKAIEEQGPGWAARKDVWRTNSLLYASGNLYRSLSSIETNDFGVRYGSNLSYAYYSQFGTFDRTVGGKGQPPRKFLTFSAEVVDHIKAMLKVWVLGHPSEDSGT